MTPLSRRQFIGATAGLAIVGNALALPARGLQINPRSSWASGLEPKGPLQAEDVRFLIVHHSASHNGHSGSDAPAILRSWFEFHTGTKGWNDVAYNFVIDSDGGIWEARKGSLDGPVAGDATGGNQGFTQLVCLIGDFNSGQPTSAARASLVSLLAWLGDRYDVSTGPGAQVTFTSEGSNKWPAGTEVTTPTVCGHRDMSKTTCPGDNFYPYVAGTLMADVATARGGSPSPTTSTTSTTSSTTSTTSTTTVAQSTTTTVPPATTTIPPAETSTTSVVATTSSAGARSPTTPTSSVPVAASPVPTGAGRSALLTTAGALIASGIALTAWRSRRMSGAGRHKGDRP